MSFDEHEYTKDAIIKQLGLIELHGKDGSAVESGCACIEEKHLFNLEGLSEEQVGFALSKVEKEFYADVSDLMRRIRKRIEVEDYSLKGLLSPSHSISPCPPTGRKFPLPKDIKIKYEKDHDEPAKVLVTMPEKDIEVILDPSLKKCPEMHDSLLQHEVVEGSCLALSGEFCHGIATRAEPEITRKLETPHELWLKCP